MIESRFMECACGCGKKVNVDLADGRQKHFAYGHRKADSKRKGQILVPCACGCGTLIPAVDNRGRPRRYVRYHQKPGRHIDRYTTRFGYVMIYVGAGHPCESSKGWAYEHRVIASRKIGRTLRKEERIHHIDGNKANNDPDNLEVYPSHAHHQVEHREEHSRKRHPDEANPTILCECGCGHTLKRYDNVGSPRRFIHGHQTNALRRRPDQQTADRAKQLHSRLCQRGISMLSLARAAGVPYGSIYHQMKGQRIPADGLLETAERMLSKPIQDK